LKIVLSEASWLENRNINIRTFRFAQEPCFSHSLEITTQLACYSPEPAKDIFKTFEDYYPE